jgi:hypothetical protein
MLLLAVLLVLGIEGAYREIARRERSLETPPVVLDQSSVGAITLTFSDGRASEVVDAIRLNVSGAGPVRIERILAVPHVISYRGHSSGTNPALAPEPMSFQPAHRGRDWGHSWDVGDEQWELENLPFTIQPGAEIELPVIRVVVQDATEAERLIAESDSTVLEVDIRVYTSVGVFRIAADKPILGTRITSSTPRTSDAGTSRRHR